MHLLGEKWKIPSGDVVTVLEQKGRFVKVILPTGLIGMVHEANLKEKIHEEDDTNATAD